MFDGRTGEKRIELLSRYGGTPGTEEAVNLGLQWLAKQQRDDGAWSMIGPYSTGGLSENMAGATALALLAFLGDGQTHQNGKYKNHVDRGINILIAAQTPDGFFGSPNQGNVKILSEVQRMYAQAIASIAICEAYGMTGDSSLRPHAEESVKFALESQASNGGWRYRPGMYGDTSVTGWFLMLIQSARSAGIEVPQDNLARVSRFLDSVASQRGSVYSYMPGRQPSPSMTAAALLCRQYLGWPRMHPSLVAGVQNLASIHPFEVSGGDVYYCYCATQVFHQEGGEAWEKWNLQMREQLPLRQVKTGREAGSWNPVAGDPWAKMAGRLYSTCLSIYSLKVYYRHMPIYQPVPDEEEFVLD